VATERFVIVVEERGAANVSVTINEIGRAAEKSQKSVGFLQRALLGFASIQSLRVVTRTLADFEQQLSTVRGITNATEEQFAALRDVAEELGATTRFSASQAAEGLVFLARAGFTVDEQLKSIGGTLTLAQAGALDLGSAADIASNVLRGFRLEADETGRAVDVLAKAANSSNTTVLQLGDALKFVAPIAAGVGVSMEEATAAVGALSDAGLQASLAGTGLRRVLSELESPSKKTTEILSSLGVTTDRVRISQVGLQAALETLADAGLDTGQALEVFGDRGGPAFEVLSQAIPRLRVFTEQLNNAEGTAERLAAVMDDNLNGAILAARSALEALILALGQAGVVDALEAAFQGAAAALRFTAENAEILAGALVGLAVAQIPRLIAAIPALIASLRSLSVAIAGTGIGAIAVVVGLAVGALIQFQDQIFVTSGGFATLGDVFAEVGVEIRAIVSDIGVVFAEVFGSLPGFLEPLAGQTEVSLGSVLVAVARFGDRFVGVFRGAVFAAVELFRGLGPAVQDLAIGAVDKVIRAIEASVRGVQALFVALGQALGVFVSQVGVGLTNLAEASRQALAGNLDEARAFAENAAFFIANAAGQGFEGFAGNVAREFAELDADPLLERLQNPSEGAADRLGQAVGDAFFEGFNQTNLEDSVLGVLDRAEERARARAAGGAVAAPGASLDPAAPAGNQAGLDAQRASAIEELNAALAEQARLLGLTNREREIATGLADIEAELARQSITLSEQELALFDERLRNLQALEDQARLLDEIRGPQEELIARQAALNALYAQGRINADEYSEGLRNIQRAALETDKSLSGGFERGLLRIGDTLINFGDQAEATLVNAFGAAEDALVQFVQTGELDFGKLVDSILADLTRLLARQALLGLLGGLGGGGGAAGGLLGGLFGGGRADGGPVGPDRMFAVGERGPELFVPDRPGTIIPNEALRGGQAAPPVVNVSVVNVTDPNEVSSALNDSGVQDQIVNVIRRNKSAVKQALGVG
jgi:TP901 family phage tail tape measure protein/lambda family phage tail tape measure protein